MLTKLGLWGYTVVVCTKIVLRTGTLAHYTCMVHIMSRHVRDYLSEWTVLPL